MADAVHHCCMKIHTAMSKGILLERCYFYIITFAYLDLITDHSTKLESHVLCLRLDRYRYWVTADTYLSIGTDTRSPVVRLPVSTVNTVATHAYSFKTIPYFCAYTPHTYNLHITIPRTKCTFSTKNLYQLDIGIGISIAAANSIGYRVPAWYWSKGKGKGKRGFV